MVDERDPKATYDESNQEYSYPEKGSQEFGSSPLSGGTENLASLLKNKRLMTIIGGVVGVYIILNLFGGSDEIVEDVQPVAEAPVEQPQQPQVEPQPEASSPMALFESLNQTEKEVSKSDEHIEKLESKILSLTRQSNEFRKSIKAIEANIANLTMMAKNSQAQLTTLMDKQAKKASAEPKERKRGVSCSCDNFWSSVG